MKHTLKNRVLLGVFMCLLMMLYIMKNDKLSFYIVCAFGLLLLLDILSCAISSVFLTLMVKTQKGVGENVEIEITLYNKGIFPAFVTTVELEIINALTKNSMQVKRTYCVMPFARRTDSIILKSFYCGEIETRVVQAMNEDCFHIMKKEISQSITGKVMCYPGEMNADVQTLVSNQVCTVEQSRYLHRKGNDPTEILDIRDYQPGDNVKAIHWKMTGKLGRTVMKELDMPTSQDTLLLFCVTTVTPENVDRVVQYVANVSQNLLREDVQHDTMLAMTNGTAKIQEIVNEFSYDIYIESILQGDVEVCYEEVMARYNQMHLEGRYSNVICVTDCEMEKIQGESRIQFLVAG